MEFYVTEKKGFKKNFLRLRETWLFKTKSAQKKTIKMSEKWIEMTEKPETITKSNHENS